MVEKKYIALENQSFSRSNCSIVPIRFEDSIDIMRWRNEQIYHLRQANLLTEDDQNRYFNNVISKLFDQEQPDQILFSYLENNKCIGYGGLVHINWLDKNAEISFIINTELEKDSFHKHWSIFLDLIEEAAFEDLKLHKLFTYAFDLRPHLYNVLEAKGYHKEAVLKEHCHIGHTFKDVIIHSKINRIISVRKIRKADLEIIYEWANDELTRKNSFSSDVISFESHREWFFRKLNDPEAFYFICSLGGEPAGLVRFDWKKAEKHFIISITISPLHRGRGLAYKFIDETCKILYLTNPATVITAYIKKENSASIKTFEKAKFTYDSSLFIRGVAALKYILKNE